jgi:KRAB domain-containing zinc finger protein
MSRKAVTDKRNENKQAEDIDYILNNIKEEPAVEYELILPPFQIQVEETQKQQKPRKKFECYHCKKSFQNQSLLKTHKEIHKPKVKCGICGKKVSRLHLKTHLKTHENIKKFCCDHCTDGFVTKQYLVRHMWKHRSAKKFNCKHCKQGFNDNRNFKLHLVSHSVNPRPFQCDLCPNNYPRKQNLEIHLTSIHLERQFKCDKCRFVSKWKSSLYMHKKIVHSTAKPFSCPVCEKKFKKKANVKRHESVHKMKELKV